MDMPKPRRAATAPLSQPPPSTVETLYNHPCVKITAFTAGQLERTIAVGPFRIYRAPGSVAFLSCGSALQPILPRSQCWCITQDNSRFVLQIRRPQYWRIELPVEHPDDAHRAVILRQVLDSILLFEKTECPFERAFSVALPDPPTTPLKKKAWTAEGKNLIASPFESDLSPPAQTPAAISRGTPTRTHSASLRQHRGDITTAAEALPETDALQTSAPPATGISRRHSTSWPYELELQRNGPSVPSLNEATDQVSASHHQLAPYKSIPTLWGVHTPQTSSASSTDLDPALSRDDHERVDLNASNTSLPLKPDAKTSSDDPTSFEGSGNIAPINLARKRVARVLSGRSFTAPPQLALITSPSPRPVKGSVSKTVSPTRPLGGGSPSPTPSTDSFHSMQSWHSPITPPISRSQSPHGSQYEDVSSDSPLRTLDSLDQNSTLKVNPGASLGSTGATDDTGSLESTPTNHKIVDEDLTKSAHVSEGPRPSAEEDIQPLRQRSRPTNLSISRRALSPLPPAANLFSPPARRSSVSPLDVVRGLPTAIVHKTVEILLSPPSHLINLMLGVAARIVAGEWRGLVFGFSEAGESIPVEWDYFSDSELGSLTDDDGNYVPGTNNNVSQGNTIHRSHVSGPNDQGSWEVD
ncbi:inheritance of peroxisomes protein 1-domain-containing protein [Xylariaceae sp. FL0255]|nr:inheritance of peroxisomes protein 1-domain-containing protein [Xylariaceae sp. FL0255]